MLNPESVILNLVQNLFRADLFQHLIKSTCSETLKRVQGDQKILSQRCQTGKLDKFRFINIAQESLEECRYYLILARDLGYSEINDLMSQAEEVSSPR